MVAKIFLAFAFFERYFKSMKRIYNIVGYVFVAGLIAYAVVAYLVTTVNSTGTYDGFGRKQYALPEGFRIQSVPNILWVGFDFLLFGAGFLAVKHFFNKAKSV